MLLGCIADDLTGATDLAVNLRREGLTVVQVNGVPRAELAATDADAVVVALKSRTIAAADACRMALDSMAWLRAHGAQRIFFKYCSTFDSTPEGNIGPVTDVLADALAAPIVPATPAYPRNQRTVYLGHLFVGEELLSESSMRNHPLTPMTDANLVRVLQAQTAHRVGLVTYAAVDAGADAIVARLHVLREQGCRHAVIDATTDAHLRSTAQAAVDLPLTTGGAGLGMGLAAALRDHALGRDVATRTVRGPAVILAGSCSQATLAQIAAVTDRLPARRIAPEALAAGPGELADAIAWARAHLGARPVLISASVPPDQLARTQAALGRERAATLVEDAFRDIARELAAAGVRRFVVAGGETSGAVVESLAGVLGFQALAVGTEIAPGVPWMTSVDGEAVALALKS
ncbi:MAG: 3-oxo-tetronate kinase, partial [Gemmatimonadota bacterium]